MRLVTLSALRQKIRDRCDSQNTQFITDIELTGYINDSICELYDLLVEKYGDEYFLKTGQITLVKGQDTYSLPSDFLKLKGIDLIINASEDPITLKRFNFQERNRNKVFRYNAVYNLMYRIMGNNLMITPLPDITNVMTMYYVPASVVLVNDSDTFDGYNGWEEYVVSDCMIKVQQKSEEDTSVAIRQKIALIKRIEDASANRDAGQPERVTDSYRSNRHYFWGTDNY